MTSEMTFIQTDLAEKGKFWASTLFHKMCPRKQTTEPKLLILISFFSGEDTSSTDTCYGIRIFWEVCRSVFLGHPGYANDYNL